MIAALFAAWAGELRIEDLVKCEGDEIPAGTQVTVHYTGRLEDGTQFDSSYDRRQPLKATLGKGALIEGWEIGLQGMSVGCRRRLVVPPELGYGNRTVGGKIPANSTLIFEIELLGLEAGRPNPPAAPREADALVTTDSGLRYQDFTVGEGPIAMTGRTATVEYTLWLPDGTIVDSSYKRDKPFSYGVGRGMVIAGWEEGVLGMRVGGVRQLRVPWELGYGRRGHPPRIPPKSELIFEIELVDVR